MRAAEESLRAEAAEAEAAWREQYAAAVDALAEEPQFAIINPFNGETLVVAAQSMIWPLGVNGRGEPLEEPEVEATGGMKEFIQEQIDNSTSKIVLPGTAAALGVETP